jgi:hypothetical protein
LRHTRHRASRSRPRSIDVSENADGFRIIASLTPLAAWGQVNATTISGRVKDASGATIPGATIHIVNQDTVGD